MPDAKIIFGRRLRLLRKSQGMTLEALGGLASIGYKHIADIERGEKTPSFESMQKLADALHVPVSDLFADDANSGSPLPSIRALAKEIENNSTAAVRRLVQNFLVHVRDLEAEIAARQPPK